MKTIFAITYLQKNNVLTPVRIRACTPQRLAKFVFYPLEVNENIYRGVADLVYRF